MAGPGRGSSPPPGAADIPELLLIEPDRMVRSTVSGVCRGMDLAQVHQAATLALLARLRESHPKMEMAVMASSANAAIVQQLKALGIRRLLLQPFKIRDVVMTVQALCEVLPLAATAGP